MGQWGVCGGCLPSVCTQESVRWHVEFQMTVWILNFKDGILSMELDLFTSTLLLQPLTLPENLPSGLVVMGAVEHGVESCQQRGLVAKLAYMPLH